MNKADWYADRIMWKAGKNRLNDYYWSNFELVNPQEAKTIQAFVMAPEAPLVIFWRNSDNWTLLTNQYLRGRIDGVLSSVCLDEISDVSTLNEKNVPANEFKREAEYILVGKNKKIFWTPQGGPHFSMKNILGIFPLNVPA